jgi:hypothetical protein
MIESGGVAMVNRFPGSRGGYWARTLDGDEVVQHSFWLFDDEEGARAAEATYLTLGASGRSGHVRKCRRLRSGRPDVARPGRRSPCGLGSSATREFDRCTSGRAVLRAPSPCARGRRCVAHRCRSNGARCADGAAVGRPSVVGCDGEHRISGPEGDCPRLRRARAWLGMGSHARRRLRRAAPSAASHRPGGVLGRRGAFVVPFGSFESPRGATTPPGRTGSPPLGRRSPRDTRATGRSHA